MKKSIPFKFSTFLVQISLLTIAFFFVHYTIINLFFNDQVTIYEILKIYAFLFVTVVAFVYLLTEQSKKNSEKILQTFLLLSMAKMILIFVFLLPLFIGKVVNLKLAVANFFIPYFLYLIFEIRYSLRLLNFEK
jgi:hypothetical protein